MNRSTAGDTAFENAYRDIDRYKCLSDDRPRFSSKNCSASKKDFFDGIDP
jgi:hypothetical protein